MQTVQFRLCISAAALFVAGVLAGPADAARIKDLCEVQGVRGNDLRGIGLVVGLAGTGDKSAAALRAQQHVLERMDMEIESLKDLKTDNTAVVTVTAVLPPYAKEGTRIDVTVAAVGDCKSLEGGVLLETLLYGGQGDSARVYAVAQGPVTVGGFNAGGGGTNVQKNHPTVGRLPMGAYVEREVPSTITDGERLTLVLKRPDFATADNIQRAINRQMGEGTALALGAGAVNVRIPKSEQQSLIGFIAKLEQMDVEADVPAKVVINVRTGTIVVGGNVSIRPCQVAHGNLTITVQSTPVVSQPPPFSGGETVVSEIVDVVPEEETAALMAVEGTSAGDVAMALNKLKATPRDMIAIFQALREAGALEADLELM